MANLEQNRQESLDLIQEEVDSMDVNTPMDNSQKALNLIDLPEFYHPIDIPEKFDDICKILKKWTELEKETVKLKLLLNLGNEKIKMDYQKTTIELIEKDGKKSIVLKEKYGGNWLISGEQTCILKFEKGRWYYTQYATKAMAQLN